MNAQRDELEDYGKNMQQVYESGFSYPAEDAMQFDDEGIPQFTPYVFGGLHSLPFHYFRPIMKICQKRIINTWIRLPHHGLF